MKKINFYTSEDLFFSNFGVIPQEVTDLDDYKKNYPNYFEVIITPDGKIWKANPSHQLFLSYLLAKKKGMTIDELNEWATENCNPEDLWGWLDYLIRETNSIAVWYNIYKGNPNPKQLEVLKECKRKEVYDGAVDY